MAKLYWRIRGYDGTRKIFECVVPAAQLTEAGIIAMLQRLVARHLSERDVVAASLRPRHRAPHLDVSKSSRPYGYMTQSTGDHYSAMIEEDGQRN